MVQAKSLIVILIFLIIVGCEEATQTQPTINNSVELEPEVNVPDTPAPVSPPPQSEFKSYYPDEVYFWVNDLLIPQATLYNGSKFIAIRESQIRTFAGSFGPYFDNPLGHINVTLCAELTKAQAAPACERIDLIYRENYVSFAKGYGGGEFIGGRVYKDYTAYYNVQSDNTQVAASNKAVIRTVG